MTKRKIVEMTKKETEDDFRFSILILGNKHPYRDAVPTTREGDIRAPSS